MSYSDDLKNPLWQRKRLEIMDRDQFQCQCCFNKTRTLTVHHKWYKSELKPWEYEDDCYITMCELCHKEFHLKIGAVLSSLFNNETDIFIFKERLFWAVMKNGDNTLKQLNSMLVSMIVTEEEI